MENPDPTAQSPLFMAENQAPVSAVAIKAGRAGGESACHPPTPTAHHITSGQCLHLCRPSLTVLALLDCCEKNNIMYLKPSAHQPDT